MQWACSASKTRLPCPHSGHLVIVTSTSINSFGSGPRPRTENPRPPTHGGQNDAIERASRILAQAFGYGDSWFTADCQFDASEAAARGEPTGGLPIARRTETLERADRAANVGEFHHWKRAKGIAVMPRVRPKRNALGSLAFAKLDGPLEDWLLVYALQDWSRWPRVRRFAIACRPDPVAIDDAAQRILWRTAEISQDQRANALRKKAETYRRSTRAAESMLREWLNRAAAAFLQALNGEGGGAE